MQKKYEVRVDITVTKSLYTSASSQEEAEKNIRERLNKDPYPDTKTMDSVLNYEIVEVSECEEEDAGDDPLAGCSKDYRKGVAYVMENMDEDDKALIRAKCNKSYSQHLVPNGSIVDDSSIIDLLEEYGQNESLSEGWYLDEYDASVILAMI